MPELPEIETCRLGIEPHVTHQYIDSIIVRESRLRWPIPDAISQIEKQKILSVTRRGKYLLLNTKKGSAILHLGMSGRLHLTTENTPPKKHDHVDIIFKNNLCLRFHDPRRFGALLWCDTDPLQHELLRHMGPEPLGPIFTAKYLFTKTQESSRPIKLVLMDSHIVAGIGNIYANEALFLAGIKPQRKAHSINHKKIDDLYQAIQKVLQQAIKKGGTTLRDFLQADGKPGYFQQTLQVYGREEQPCIRCQQKLRKIVLAQRTTVYCNNCQK